jgi:hypothetical protein
MSVGSGFIFVILDPLKLPHKLPLKSSRLELQVAPPLSQSQDLKAFIHMVGLPFFTFAAKSFVS